MVDADEVISKAKSEKSEVRDLLRPVAEWFHSREGELFERYEAAEEIRLDPDVDCSDERVISKVVSNLASDRVDPVQNVVSDGERQIGVIDYEEHVGWYEYVEANDVHGRMNIGVCAKCVEDADSDGEVARGCGTTEELSERIREHYAEDHTESPDTVETGATLVSGTTIAGNTAIHTGNDGLGSGLDADTVRGTPSSSIVLQQSALSETVRGQGTILTSLPETDRSVRGIGLDSDDSIWHSDPFVESFFQLDQTGSVLTQFASPSTGPSGVGIDSDDSIWNAERNGESIFQLNQTGTVQTGFVSPSSDGRGLGIDSDDSIWHVDEAADSFFQLDKSGTELTRFSSPSSGPHGVGLGSDDSIWHVDNNVNSLYELDQNGTVLNQFDSPSNSPRGLGLDSNDCIWVHDGLFVSILQITRFDTRKYE